jgi:putative transposase
VGGPERGYDAGKKIAGRKRHLLVDCLGLVLVAVVHSAGLQDYEGARTVLGHVQTKFRRLRCLWADSSQCTSREAGGLLGCAVSKTAMFS